MKVKLIKIKKIKKKSSKKKKKKKKIRTTTKHLLHIDNKHLSKKGVVDDMYLVSLTKFHAHSIHPPASQMLKTKLT